jgi:DNA-binding transcriptional LysR family regulator
MHLQNWDDLKFVLAMTRHGTMSAAARFLETNVATVSRRLERMGQELDLPLFEKRGKAFVATEAARRLSELAEEVDQSLRREIGALRADIEGQPISLDVAAPPAVHEHFLLPRMVELHERFPDVQITLTEKVFAQGLGEADLQIRIGRPEGGRLRARKFRDFSMRVFHRADTPLDGEWIGLSHRYPDADRLRDIYRDAKRVPRYRVEEMRLVRQLMLTTGLPGLIPDFTVLPEDDLVPAPIEGNEVPGELWITYHETRHADQTLRALMDWICASDRVEAAA